MGPSVYAVEFCGTGQQFLLDAQSKLRKGCAINAIKNRSDLKMKDFQEVSPQDLQTLLIVPVMVLGRCLHSHS